MRFKIFFIIFLLLYQTSLYSKGTEKNEFNQKYLSNYFSALLSHDNQKNDQALKFFESSKFLIKKHDNFLKEYVFSLVLNGQVKKSIKQIKTKKNPYNSNFFEANLLLIIDRIQKKKFAEASKLLDQFKKYKVEENYQFIIYKTLESYNNLFLNNNIKKLNKDYGKLSLITLAFQNCYLDSNNANSHFLNVINSDETNYSRYLFFYLGNIIENKDIDMAKEIASTIDPLNSGLLVSQSKKWIEDKKFSNFNKYFSCKNPNDLLAEFFFLISNLFSSQENYEYSNFYINISNYLNSKFYFNLTLIAENHYSNKNFELANKILEKINDEDEIFFWYKTKKKFQIFSYNNDNEDSIKFIEKKIKVFKNPSIKILYDIANIYKNFKKYQKAIEYYSLVLYELDNFSSTYADVLYRRGGSFERIGDYEKSDIDLLNSLKIRPDDPYILNYLAYGWLERNYKIKDAIQMLNKAYTQEKNDPYITDSVGWGYYIIGDYKNAEKYLRWAVELLPNDPITNDHYGDVLWKLNRKLQAKYFWESALKNEETEEKMKKEIQSKLLNGLKKT